jgi:hypothetical protein
VGRQDHRDVAVAVQPLQQLLHFELVADVERRRGLVEEQQFGILGERAGDHDALLFRRR